MDYLEEQLVALDTRRSRDSVDAINSYCAQHQLYDGLYSSLVDSSPRRRGTIMWVLARAVYGRTWYPSLHILEALADRLAHETDVMSKRCTLDIFQYAHIPESRMGTMTDTCISLIRSKKESIAVRALAITVLFRIIKIYPDLFYEVKDVIVELSRTEGPAIRFRAKKALETMDKIS